ncbi:MAG TPA: hypothetical protein VNS34_19210 [Rhizobiaceae bacterium]|nr:hypothetical protein [Rhizobiaceae bacterium]
MPIKQGTFAQTALLLAAIGLIEGASPAPTLADERVCGELWAELASAPEPGGSDEYKKFSRAAGDQREQIMIARRQARDARCGFYAHAGRPGCAPINAKIERMERNLASLQHRRAELAREERHRQNRSRILAALNANDCGDRRLISREEAPQRSAQERIPPQDDGQRDSPLVVTQPRPASVLENLGGTAPKPDSGANSPARNFTIIAGNPPSGKPLAGPDPQPPARTDNSLPLGTETVPPAQDGQVVLPGGQNAPSPSVLEVLVPAEKPGILAAPPQTDKAAESALYEQPAGRKGEPTAAPLPSPEATPHDPGERKVRVVGPTFLPDPEGAINLRAPVRKQAR